MKLTDNACRTNTRGKKSDGGGLYLNIRSKTSRLWQMAYRFDGKQKTLSFGPYPVVTLAAARASRDRAKALLAAGIDPITVRKGEAAPSAVPVERRFETVAWRWFDNSGNLSDQYRRQVKSQIERFILPSFMGRDIGTITSPEVVTMLRAIEATGISDSVRRCRQFTSGIFCLAVAEGLAQGDPAAPIAKARVLKPRKPPVERPRVPQSEIPELLLDIARFPNEQVRLALQLTLHTALRSSEVREGLWAEIKGGEWHIPSRRMKMPRAHIVPLTPQVKAILAQLRRLARNSPFILPAGPMATVSETMQRNKMNDALMAMGYAGRQVPHGFRSLFSTAANESGLWKHEWIEKQLAHEHQSAVARAYNAAEHLPDRARLMAWWSDRLDDLAKYGELID